MKSEEGAVSTMSQKSGSDSQTEKKRFMQSSWSKRKPKQHWTATYTCYNQQMKQLQPRYPNRQAECTENTSVLTQLD